MSWIQHHSPGLHSAIWRENDHLYAGFIPGQYAPTVLAWWISSEVTIQYFWCDRTIYLAGDIVAEGEDIFPDKRSRDAAWDRILRDPSTFLMEKML